VIRNGKEDHGILAVPVNLLSYPGLAPEIHARSTDPALKREDPWLIQERIKKNPNIFITNYLPYTVLPCFLAFLPRTVV
jgi:hypothetical protein